MRSGLYLFGMATVATGIMDLVWGDFEAAHQPIQAFGDDIPGREMLAYLAAIWLIAGGTAILWRRTARVGAAAVALIYFIFAVFWLPRFYTATQVLGFRIPVFIGVLAGVAQQAILVAAAAIVYASAVARGSSWPQRAAPVVRWAFGLSSVCFGLAHLAGVQAVAAMVPRWMPLGGNFWTVLTGIAFMLAGAAILARTLDVLAARLLALMLLIFTALVLAPPLLALPRNHVAWGSNAYNLAAVGAAWLFADSIQRKQDAEKGMGPAEGAEA